MNPLKRILGHIYFAYGALLFVLTMLIVFIPAWLTTRFKEPMRSRLLHPVFQVWMGVFLPLVGCPVFRKGKHFFKKGENYVVVCNHNSFVDVPVSSPFIPGPNKTLAKIEISRAPLFGVIYKAGSILVDREKEGSRRESYGQMQQMLEKGLHLCLYPEGKRNKTEEPMQAFHDGAFRAAVLAQKPVIPAVIFNTRAILPNKPKAWARPKVIRFHFLEPLPTAGLTPADVPALKEEVRNRMVAYYLANQ